MYTVFLQEASDRGRKVRDGVHTVAPCLLDGNPLAVQVDRMFSHPFEDLLGAPLVVVEKLVRQSAANPLVWSGELVEGGGKLIPAKPLPAPGGDDDLSPLFYDLRNAGDTFGCLVQVHVQRSSRVCRDNKIQRGVELSCAVRVQRGGAGGVGDNRVAAVDAGHLFLRVEGDIDDEVRSYAFHDL